MHRVIQIDLCRWGVYRMLEGGELSLRFVFSSEDYARRTVTILDAALRAAARRIERGR